MWRVGVRGHRRRESGGTRSVEGLLLPSRGHGESGHGRTGGALRRMVLRGHVLLHPWLIGIVWIYRRHTRIILESTR